MSDGKSTSAKHYSGTGLFRYQVLLIILLPVLVAYTIVLSIKNRSLRYLLQRLAILSPSTPKCDLWIHAASVGEVNASIPFINAFRAIYPDSSILLTTVTPTGAALFNRKQIKNSFHLYLPIDFPKMLVALIWQCKPKCLVVMETEIWPNLFRVCHQNGIPVCTVNGRLSQKTLNTAGWIRSLYQTTLQYSSKILTRSDQDKKAYIALGADPEKVTTVGNIKFSAEINAPRPDRTSINRRYILAASTHDNEELIIATMWKQRSFRLLSGKPLLVIAPRHPNRLATILKDLKTLDLQISIRSRDENITDDTDIYIVDTVGELTDFMTDADIVFMGGSLVPVGGHNIIEPAALGKPIVFGPYMENFAIEAELLTSFNAAIKVDNVDQLGDTLQDALANPDKYTDTGLAAKQLVDKYKDTASRYVKELDECFAQL